MKLVNVVYIMVNNILDRMMLQWPSSFIFEGNESLHNITQHKMQILNISRNILLVVPFDKQMRQIFIFAKYNRNDLF